jgi:hypothetical protein
MASTASPGTSDTRIRHESPRHDPPAGSRAPTGVTRLVCLDRRGDASPRGHVPAPARSRAVAPAHGRPNPTPARHRARQRADAIPIAPSSQRFRPTRPLRTAAPVSTTPQSGLVAAAALRKKRSALSDVGRVLLGASPADPFTQGLLCASGLVTQGRRAGSPVPWPRRADTSGFTRSHVVNSAGRLCRLRRFHPGRLRRIA